MERIAEVSSLNKASEVHSARLPADAEESALSDPAATAAAVRSLLDPAPADQGSDKARLTEVWLGTGILAVVAVLFGLSIQDQTAVSLYHGGALLILLVGLISTKAVPDHVAALTFFVVAVGVAAIPSEVVTSGFYSGASWLIFSVSIIAVALTETGLSAKVARTVLGRVGNSYASVIATIAVVSFILMLLLPSTAARILLLIPIILALADRLGYGPHSKGRTGMVIATLTMSFLPAASILTSGNRTLVMAGLAQTLYGIEFRYSDFVIWNFPVLTFLVVVLIAGLVIWRYREPPAVAAQTIDATTPHDPSRKFVLGIVLCALALWLTDFFHHISPAWVGLAAVVAFMVGPSRNLALFE